MLPRYLTGSMVTLAKVPFPGCTITGIIIAVAQANGIPDAKVRGIDGSQTWSYWVLTNDNLITGVRVLGPLMGTELQTWPC